MKRTADEVLANRLEAEVRKLLAGRTVVDAVVLLTNINNALAAADQAEAVAKSKTVH